MSLITQCPACTTLFKVVPDQLRMSDGWVRCGQCDEVFDANANIRDVAVTAAPPQIPAPQPAEPSEANAFAADAFAHAGTVEEITAAPPIDSEAPEHVLEDVLDPMPQQPVAQELALPDAVAPVDPFLNKSPKELSDFSAAVSAASLQDELRNDTPLGDGTSERRYMQMFAPDAEAQEDPKLSFIKPVRPPSLWTHRGVRAALAACCAVLAVLVALQVVVHERNRLAAQYPEFQAALQSVCTALGLEIGPLRQIEAIVIDSSAFSKVRNDVYKLSFTLRNTSATTLATPAMELTLTDMQDQVVLRKVLAPADFASVPVVLNAGAEAGATLPLSVRMPVPAERVSGYRLLAFYP